MLGATFWRLDSYPTAECLLYKGAQRNAFCIIPGVQMISPSISLSRRPSGFTDHSPPAAFTKVRYKAKSRGLLLSSDPLYEPVRSDTNFPLNTPPTHTRPVMSTTQSSPNTTTVLHVRWGSKQGYLSLLNGNALGKLFMGSPWECYRQKTILQCNLHIVRLTLVSASNFHHSHNIIN